MSNSPHEPSPPPLAKPLWRQGVPWLTLIACGLIAAGCATHQAPHNCAPSPVVTPVSPLVCDTSESEGEIAHLQRLLTDKEAEIKQLRASQKNQDKLLKEAASQTTHAEVKLRRFATETDAASLLAEVEVALIKLRSLATAPRQDAQLTQAQQLLDRATSSFWKADYDNSVDLSIRARQSLDILAVHIKAPAANKRAPTAIPFKIMVALNTKVDTNLRRQPQPNAAIITVLPQGTPITARAYQGNWLQVETEDGATGWIFNNLIEER